MHFFFVVKKLPFTFLFLKIALKIPAVSLKVVKLDGKDINQARRRNESEMTSSPQRSEQNRISVVVVFSRA